jgi:hypothetical protein
LTVQCVLRDTSRILESLSTSSGVQSFILAVDPFNPSDAGFLGGSVVGREFWRGFRGGGETGARSFKTHCTSQLRSKEERMDLTSSQTTVSSRLSVPPAPKTYHAKSLKNELYEIVRSALRFVIPNVLQNLSQTFTTSSASGVRTAEMKWTNPERLDVYGVRLVGWPEGVPSQNPSSLKSGQNKLLLAALQNGTMRFERLLQESSAVNSGEDKSAEDPSSANETADDFSWAYDADAGPSSPIQERSPNSTRSTTIPACSITPFATNGTPSSSLDEHGEIQQETWNLEDHIIGNDAHYSTDYTWGDELHDSTNSVDVWGVADGEHLESERPRKRLRSEEPPTDMVGEL